MKRLLSPLIILATTTLATTLLPAVAPALPCDAPAVTFDSGLPPGWESRDLAGTGALWASTSNCGEDQNWAGTGSGACASSDTAGRGPFDTVLVTPTVDLSARSNAHFSFALNYQAFADDDRLELELSTDGGATWTVIRSFHGDAGGFRALDPVLVEIDLTPWVGQPEVSLRWRYRSRHEDAWGWYTQIDEVALRCDIPSPCGPGVSRTSRLLDGGFEQGTPSPAWAETSTVFSTPICSLGLCGVPGAHRGDGFAFLGGSTSGPESGSLEQTVTLYPGDATLTLELWKPATSGNSVDRFRVTVDGAEVFALEEASPGFASGYRPVQVNLAAFADGLPHQLRLEGVTTGPSVHSNFFVDSVELRGCPDVSQPPEVRIDDALAVETDGPGFIHFPITLSHPWIQDLSITFETSDDTASAGTDYLANSGQIIIPSGATTGTIEIEVIGDLQSEGLERFEMRLITATPGTLSRPTASGTIEDDDVTVSFEDTAVAEGDFGVRQAVVTAVLDRPSSHDISFNWSTADGSALAESDYAAAASSAIIPASELGTMFSIDVLGDRWVEGAESFTVELDQVMGGKIGGLSSTVQIIDDDIAAVSLTGVSVSEGSGGSTPATVLVSLFSPEHGPHRSGSEYRGRHRRRRIGLRHLGPDRRPRPWHPGRSGRGLCDRRPDPRGRRDLPRSGDGYRWCRAGGFPSPRSRRGR